MSATHVPLFLCSDMMARSCQSGKALSNKKPHRDLFLDRGAGWGRVANDGFQSSRHSARRCAGLAQRSAIVSSGVLRFSAGTFVVRSPKWSGELVREAYRLARSITDGKKQAALVVSGVLSGLERAG